MHSLLYTEWMFTVVATSFSPRSSAVSKLQNRKLMIALLRLHRRVRNHRRSQIRKDRSPAQRTSQQNRRHIPPVQHPGKSNRKLGQLVAPRSFVRLHHLGMPPSFKLSFDLLTCFSRPLLPALWTTKRLAAKTSAASFSDMSTKTH